MQNSWCKTESDKMAVLKDMSPHQQQEKLLQQPKRFRSAFTTAQINYLEKQFKDYPYISREHRREVAACLNMDERPIKIWFQNRRMREKKDNYKECSSKTSNNYSNSPQEFSNDQLNNVRTVPSTNELRSYPLLTMPLTIDTAVKSNNDISKKPNNIEHKVNSHNKPEESRKHSVISSVISQPTAHYYKEVNHNNQEHYFHRPILPFPISTNKISPSQKTSGEFSINLCKKKRESDASCLFNNVSNQEQNSKKIENRYSSGKTRSNHKTSEEILASMQSNVFSSSSKPIQMEQPCVLSIPSKQVSLDKTTYYPIMPTMYAPQLMSSDGIIWKPVIPVVAPNSKSQGIASDKSKCCECDCHGSAPHYFPMPFSQGLQNSYAQYVISVPYQNSSP